MTGIRLFLRWMARLPTGVIARLKLRVVHSLRRQVVPPVKSHFLPFPLPRIDATCNIQGITARTSLTDACGP